MKRIARAELTTAKSRTAINDNRETYDSVHFIYTKINYIVELHSSVPFSHYHDLSPHASKVEYPSSNSKMKLRTAEC